MRLITRVYVHGDSGDGSAVTVSGLGEYYTLPAFLSPSQTSHFSFRTFRYWRVHRTKQIVVILYRPVTRADPKINKEMSLMEHRYTLR